MPHWNNRCRMECCQRLHPQRIVFKEQRPSPLCEVLAAEICESAYPSPAKNNVNAEAPALKRKKEKPVNLSTRPNEISKAHTKREFGHILARIWHNSACRNVCFAMAKKALFEKRCFYGHGFRSAGIYMYVLSVALY